MVQLVVVVVQLGICESEAVPVAVIGVFTVVA